MPEGDLALSPLIHKRKVKFFYYFICMFLVRIVYITLMRRLSRIIHYKTDYTTYLYYGIMWFFLIVGILDSRTYFRLRFLLFVVSALLIMAVNCLCHEYCIEYVCPPSFGMKILTFDCTSLLNTFLFIIFGSLICDYSFFMDCLHKTARLAILGVILTDILTILVLKNKRYDDMSYAYCVCLITCIELFWFLEKRNLLDGIFSLIGTASILLCGTRGAVICILLLFAIWSFFYQKKTSLRVIAISAFLIILLLLYTGIFANAAKSASEWLEERKLPGFRILDMLQTNEISDDSGRGKIYDAVKEGIRQKMIFGYGIGGDRLLTDHTYAHNIFFEFFSSFGIFFGMTFLCVIGYYLLCGIFDPDRSLGALSVILFSGAVLKLLFSSSYIFAPELFILLGIILNRPLMGRPLPGRMQPEKPKTEHIAPIQMKRKAL